MDNAGGHGSDDAIATYSSWLRIKYNVRIIHQILRSPYTNVLDLGVWCMLQSCVEKQHYMKRTNVHALVTSVKTTWSEGHLDELITKVFGRLRNVLVLIVEGQGSNDLVETKQGKRFRNLDLPQEFLVPVQGALADNQLHEQQQQAENAQENEQPTVYFDLVVEDEDDEDDLFLECADL